MPRIISIQLLVNDFGNLGSPIQQASIYPAVQNMLLAARALYLGATLTRCICIEKEAEAVLGTACQCLLLCPAVDRLPDRRFGLVRHVPLVNVVYEDRWGQAYRDL